MEISALSEIGNILAGSYLSSLADFTRLNMQPTVPSLAIDMAGAILSYGLLQFGQMGDQALLIDTKFLNGKDEVEGHFFLIPDPESFEKIFYRSGSANSMIQDNLIKVGMADLNVARQTGVLKTTGLGSCVGITLYDAKAKVAGMAHVMLPNSDIAKEGQLNIAKYADTAIPELIRLMEALGAQIRRMEAKMAGGAQMFAFGSQSDTMRIGPRNVESCKEQLSRFKIPLLAEDTGSNYGRTIEFDCEKGTLLIRSVQHGVKEL